MTIRNQIDAVTQQMRRIVVAAAAEKGGVTMRTHYADGWWELRVQPDGRVQNFGYAEEQRGAYCRVDDLTLWELAHLLEALS